jgi:Mn-dependent DtxR family transcriptional regulator
MILNLEVKVMKINESAENYLETILILTKKNGYVRSIDIAHELSFSKPSVSIAMKGLKESNYINIDEAGYITLTALGLDIAEKIYERHQIIASALISIGVKEDTAYQDSCKIEHILSDEAFERIKVHINKHKKTGSRSGDIDVVLL